MERLDRKTIERGERAEAAAWASVYEAAPPDDRATLQLTVERANGGVALRAAGFPWWFMNRIIGLGVETPADLDWLAGQIERYRAAGTPFGVSLCREAQPEGLAGWLKAQGLKNGSVHVKMMRSTDGLAQQSQGVNLREVGIEEAELFGTVGARGYGLPESLAGLFGTVAGTDGWRAFIAYEAGEPVGTGAFFVQDDVAWLGFAAVVPEHRGKGIHGALMQHRMQAAAELGCRWLVTETGRPDGDGPAPSLHNMRRLGFELAYERPDYISGQ